MGREGRREGGRAREKGEGEGERGGGGKEKRVFGVKGQTNIGFKVVRVRIEFRAGHQR